MQAPIALPRCFAEILCPDFGFGSLREFRPRCRDFTVIHQVLPQNRALSEHKICSQIALVQLCSIALRQYCINLQIRLQVYYKLTADGLQAFIANFLTKTSNGTGFGKKKPGKITFAGLKLPRNCSFAYHCFIESGCSPPDGRLRGPTCRQRNTHRAYHAQSAQRKRRGLRLHRPRR